MSGASEHAEGSFKERLRVIIFEHDTPGGKAFDIALLMAIGVSVLAVMLESVSHVRREAGGVLIAVEWGVTLLFTVEYVLRIYSAPRRLKYIFSFLGLVDLVSILPTYISVIWPGSQALATVRALRLLRIFRVLKLSNYLREANVLGSALRSSSYKITVFLGTILTLTIIMGSAMYLIEGADAGFTSIPKSLYWAIVTMTTVGYGDIAPQTVPGQVLASVLMIFGYAIIAVPTGIVSAELVGAQRPSARQCPSCLKTGQDSDASFCKYCGANL